MKIARFFWRGIDFELIDVRDLTSRGREYCLGRITLAAEFVPEAPVGADDACGFAELRWEATEQDRAVLLEALAAIEARIRAQVDPPNLG